MYLDSETIVLLETIGKKQYREFEERVSESTSTRVYMNIFLPIFTKFAFFLLFFLSPAYRLQFLTWESGFRYD